MLKTFPRRLDDNPSFSFYYISEKSAEKSHNLTFASFKKGLKQENEINKTAEPLNYPVIHFLFSPPLYFFISQF